MSFPREVDGRAAIDTGVDMRLLRTRGRAELALLIVTWPAADNPVAAAWLEELEPRLAQFAAAGDVFELVVVLRSAGDATVVVPEDANLPALERIVSLRSAPVTALIDGLVGEPVEGLASRCERVVRGRAEQDAVVSEPAATPVRVDMVASGNALIGEVVRMVRTDDFTVPGRSGGADEDAARSAGRRTEFAGTGASS